MLIISISKISDAAISNHSFTFMASTGGYAETWAHRRQIDEIAAN